MIRADKLENAIHALEGLLVCSRAMVENGLRRGEEFTHEAIVALWGKLLFETIPALTARRSGWGRRIPLPARAAGRWLARTVTLRPAR